MPTTKKRLNIILSPEVEWAITRVAKRDAVAVSAKASELLRSALLIEEDTVWNKLAETRYAEKSKHVSHTDAWK
jgi:hypothetical protein